MREDQGELFGDLGGLFAPELVSCTPIAEVRLTRAVPAVDVDYSDPGYTIVGSGGAHPLGDEPCPCAACVAYWDKPWPDPVPPSPKVLF